MTDVVGTDGTPFTMERAVELKGRLVNETFQNRADAGELTGEWIVYLPHEGKNYYLCLGAHKDGGQFTYDRVMQNCIRDFPELPVWLEAKQKQSDS